MDKQAQAEKILAQTRTINELSIRYQDLLEKVAAEKAAVAAAIPETVSALVKHERIFDHQSEKVASAVVNPVAALNLLRDVACHRNAVEIAPMGTSVGQEKSASTRSHISGAHISNWDNTDEGRKFAKTLCGSRE